MRANRIVMWAALAGLLAGAAAGQSAPYGDGQGGHDAYGRPSPGPYDRGSEPGYDQDPAGDVGFFYNELSPYGDWVRHPQYGWSWFPRHVRAGWRPYSQGRWVESDYGWTWVSSEPFGWATYHYGRWALDPQVGWLWVPGTDWAPAWVSWQHGNGYVGWAPLPPAVGFTIGVGIRLGGLDLNLGIAPRDYAFVEERRFLDDRVGGYIVPEARNVTIISNTTNITNYTVVDNRVIDHGVPIERIEQATGGRAPRMHLAISSTIGGAGMQRDVLRIYRPMPARLATVRVAARNNAGLQQAVPVPDRLQPQQSSARSAGVPNLRPVHDPIQIPVAPRVLPASRASNEREFARQQTALRVDDDKQRKALEQRHRQETAQSRANADTQRAVEQRHTAELQAQQDQRQHGQQQLQNRQQIERQAAQATAARARRPPPKPAAAPAQPRNTPPAPRHAKGHQPPPTS